MARRKRGKKSVSSKKVKEELETKPSLWAGYGHLLAVMILPWLIYASTLDAAFIWDDHNLIEMTAAKGNSAGDIFRLWTSDFWGTDQEANRTEYYRPLTTTTFMLDYLAQGKHPRGFHRTNLLIYSITCGIAFLLFRRLLGSARIALFLGLAFAALPAHTENVAWVSGRTDLVCAALMFGAMLAYFKADAKNDLRVLAVSVGLFVMSLFGKEMSITLPAIVGLHQWLNHGFSKKAVTRTLPFVVAGVIFWIIHLLAAPFIHSENVYTTAPEYILNIIRNMAFGIWYSLVPGGYDYIVTATREQAAQTFLLPSGIKLAGVILLLFGFIAGAVYATLKKERIIALASGAGLITLLPVSGIVPIGVIFAIRFLLIPSFFFLLLIGALVKKIDKDKTKHVCTAVMIVIVSVYTASSFLRVPTWQDDESLMRSILDKSPEAATAHFIMGNALASKNKEADAIVHFRKALASRPEYPEVEFNLGVMEQRRGNIAEAEKLYRSALKQKPEFRPARMALVQLLGNTGRLEEAGKVIEADPLKH